MAALGAIGFYQGDPKLLVDDLQVLRPTIFAGVPRVYSRIYDRVHSVIASSGWIKQHVFNTAFQVCFRVMRVLPSLDFGHTHTHRYIYTCMYSSSERARR